MRFTRSNRVVDTTGPHLRLRIEAGTDADLLPGIQARTGDAEPVAVEEDRLRGARDGGVDVGIGKDDVRCLAAQLERDLLQVARSGPQDALADLGRAGEGDSVDVRLTGQRSACGVAEAGYDVDHAFRLVTPAGVVAEGLRGDRSQPLQILSTVHGQAGNS